MAEPVYRFYKYFIPDYMMGGLTRYINEGIRPGHFLTAVICNDLSVAVGKADDINIDNLPAFAAYLYNEAPSPCWGSKEKMEAWIAKFEGVAK